MENESNKFQKKLLQLEDLSRKNPKSYKQKLAWFTMIGYLYIGLIFLILVASIIGIIFVTLKWDIPVVRHFIVGLVGIIILLIRSLWIRVEKPQGIYITRNDVPELFEIIDEITKVTNAPRIHKVIINETFNASVTQIATFGIFGFYKSYLMIGIQLMMALSCEELKAVLAHELGHISNEHGKFMIWIYRMSETWENIKEEFNKKDRTGGFLFKQFFNWYIPRYEIYAHILLRQNEYEADKFSVRVVGNKILAQSLLNMSIKYSYIEETFWTSIQKTSFESIDPINDVYSKLMDELKKEIDNDKKIKLLRRRLSEKKDLFDTHPTLSQRLKAIDMESFIPNEVEEMSIVLLGKYAHEYIDILNKKWKQSIKEIWEESYYEIQEYKEKLKCFQNRGGYKSLNREEKLEFLDLTYTLKDEEEALRGYLEYISEYPKSAEANFLLGENLIERGDIKGIDYIKRAMELDDECIVDGCELIYKILIDNDKKEMAEIFYEKAYKQSDYLYTIQEEKNELYIDDEYVSHELSEKEVDELVAQLKTHSVVKEAYFVRKKIKSSDKDDKIFVLGILLDLHWYTDEEKYMKNLNDIVEGLEFKYEITAIYLNLENRMFKNVFRDIKNAKLI